MTRPHVALYFQRVVNGRLEFCVANHREALSLTVATFSRAGEVQPWDRREEGELLVWRPPFGWDREGFVRLHFDPARLAMERMPDELAERLAVNNRVSA